MGITDNQLLKLEQQLKTIEARKNSVNVKELKCYNCDKLNMNKGIDEKKVNPFIVYDEDGENFYYQCIYHNTIFCSNCAHNYNEREIKHRLAPKCPLIVNIGKNKDGNGKYKIIDNQECILEKKFIIFEEKD